MHLLKYAIVTGLLLPLLLNSLAAQDTIRVMSYNLLDYPGASNIATKNGYLTTINNHLHPDIWGVVELDADSAYADNLLNNVLNAGSGSTFARANYSCTAGSGICNMLFYNNTLLGLKTQFVIPYPALREMNHYVLYYRSPNLAVTHDTIFLNVVIAHFKASMGYETERNQMATTLMEYLAACPYAPGNFIVMGDFNLYTGTEPAFQTLTNYSANAAIRFNDPLVSVPLNWHDNSAAAPYHTQSTRLASLPDGGATGGMDDRFDFQLISNSILNNTARISLVPNTYRATGQDGLRFNQNLINPTNNSAPSAVINALYNMSDHLPVVADYKIDYTPPPAATITAAGITTFCQGGSVVLTAGTGAGYACQWQQNGVNISGATAANYTATQTGNYTAQITANQQTSISNVITVTVIQTPAPVIAGTANVCLNGQETYSVLYTAGHIYLWTVSTNGAIVNGQGTNSITVQWNSGTVGTVSVSESTQ